jgi:hypothetical protein
VGLWLDEWSESIPDPAAVTGVAFHYDSPGQEPPQALLIAVPPTEAERWSLTDFAATLNETVDLAKVRAVDSELTRVCCCLPYFLPVTRWRYCFH